MSGLDVEYVKIAIAFRSTFKSAVLLTFFNVSSPLFHTSILISLANVVTTSMTSWFVLNIQSAFSDVKNF